MSSQSLPATAVCPGCSTMVVLPAVRDALAQTSHVGVGPAARGELLPILHVLALRVKGKDKAVSQRELCHRAHVVKRQIIASCQQGLHTPGEAERLQRRIELVQAGK